MARELMDTLVLEWLETNCLREESIAGHQDVETASSVTAGLVVQSSVSCTV